MSVISRTTAALEQIDVLMRRGDPQPEQLEQAIEALLGEELSIVPVEKLNTLLSRVPFSISALANIGRVVEEEIAFGRHAGAIDERLDALAEVRARVRALHLAAAERHADELFPDDFRPGRPAGGDGGRAAAGGSAAGSSPESALDRARRLLFKEALNVDAADREGAVLAVMAEIRNYYQYDGLFTDAEIAARLKSKRTGLSAKVAGGDSPEQVIRAAAEDTALRRILQFLNNFHHILNLDETPGDRGLRDHFAGDRWDKMTFRDQRWGTENEDHRYSDWCLDRTPKQFFDDVDAVCAEAGMDMDRARRIVSRTSQNWKEDVTGYAWDAIEVFAGLQERGYVGAELYH